MTRDRKLVHGRKRKFNASIGKGAKPKRGKFSLKHANYVKSRNAKNEEIERQRTIVEEERKREQDIEADSSGDEEGNPIETLLSTFHVVGKARKISSDRKTTVSSSESDSSEDEAERKLKGRDAKEGLGLGDRELVSSVKDDDEDDADAVEAMDEEVANDQTDPFSIHLDNDLDDGLYEAVSSVPQLVETKKLYWPELGTLMCQIPRARKKEKVEAQRKTIISSSSRFAREGNLPTVIGTIDWNKLHVKSQIQPNLRLANNIDQGKEHSENKSSLLNPFLTPLQRELFSIVNNYQDLYYPERSFSNANQIRFVYCLHALNHVLKTRTKVLHHNSKINKSKSWNLAEIPDEYRDQGLVRPKVLIVVPFRHSCLQIVELLIAILIGKDTGGSVINKNRFMEDFSGRELALPRKNPKPEDYEATFQGNIDDTFKIGIGVTKKSLKLYTEFYSSDIIISSVLGLRMLVGAEGEEGRDYDFLASIELLILDQAELFLMQNWDHLIHVLNHLHLQPREFHGTDFSRVRSWCANGWAKYYRQTLIFSSIQTPEIHGIFSKRCFNYAGKVKIGNTITAGTISQVVIQVPQVFHKFESSSHSQALESRLDFFLKTILPQYTDKIMNHTLIYVPSYFDFVKLRNYLKKEELSFVQICEYSRDGKVARARDMFFHSDAHFLLYSERYHFFRRIRLKGIRHIIFYAPPTFPEFYAEICNLMQEANQNPRAGSQSNMTVTVLYCKYDMMLLSAITGTERASRMLSSEKTVHMLITGEK